MQDVADQIAQTPIRADLIGTEPIDLAGHIALPRPRREDVKAQRVSRGYRCAAGALSELRTKACARTGKSFPIIVIQEAGLDGFWIHSALLSEGIESHVVDAASVATSRRRRRAKTGPATSERAGAGSPIVSLF